MENYQTDFISAFIGKKIKEKRQELGIKQIEIANSVNISRASIANIESGRQLIQIDTLYKISKILNADITHFLPYLDKENYKISFSNKEFQERDYLKSIFNDL